jgi:hypothetical protein
VNLSSNPFHRRGGLVEIGARTVGAVVKATRDLTSVMAMSAGMSIESLKI